MKIQLPAFLPIFTHPIISGTTGTTEREHSECCRSERHLNEESPWLLSCPVIPVVPVVLDIPVIPLYIGGVSFVGEIQLPAPELVQLNNIFSNT